MKQIFFVEDDGSLISGLTFALERQGYKVQVAPPTLKHKPAGGKNLMI